MPLCYSSAPPPRRRRPARRRRVLSGLALALLLAPNGPAAEFHVAPNAAAPGDGSREAPFATLEQAQAAARAARRAGPGEPVTVWLASGVYRLAHTLSFGPADSGTATAPVEWRAEQPGTAILSLARPLAPGGFVPVTDPAVLARLDPLARGKVWELDLAQAGVRHAEIFPPRFEAVTGFIRLFFDGAAQPLARWPNGPHGYTTFVRVTDSGDFRGGQPHGGTFVFRDDRPARWRTALDEGGVWLRGFWRVPWAIEGLQVKAIDPAARTVTFAVSTPNGIGSKYTPEVKGTRPGGGVENWYALNLVEEIDQPGEWAVNFRTHKLYFWPPAAPAGHELLIADNQMPVVSCENATCLTLRGLTLTQSLGDGIDLRGGHAVTVAGCTIEDVDACGVGISGGTGHRIVSCDIRRTGQYGIDFTGGRRATLTPGRHEILNNDIHDIGLAGPFPAIRAGEGTLAEVVGNHIAHNRIHDCPNAGVRYGGNDNLIELNEIYRVGLDSGDLGAFYTNSGWTSRGNVLRHNLVHHARNAQAFYLDDGDCGDTVEGNIALGVQSGVFVGGGSDHQIRHNVFIDCDRGLHIDARGRARAYTLKDPRLAADLASVPYRQSPWREKYPALAGIAERDTTLPTGVDFDGNLVVDCAVDVRRSATPEELAGVHFGALRAAPRRLFQAPERLDFTITDPALLKSLLPGFPGIPWSTIGLQPDELRPVVPERNWAQLDAAPTARQRFDSQTDVDASNRH